MRTTSIPVPEPGPWIAQPVIVNGCITVLLAAGVLIAPATPCAYAVDALSPKTTRAAHTRRPYLNMSSGIACAARHQIRQCT
jgi:hypothetical protein